MSSELMTLREVAQAIGCSVSHVHNLVASGQLALIDLSSYARPGRSRTRNRILRIRRADLEAWLQARTIPVHDELAARRKHR